MPYNFFISKVSVNLHIQIIKVCLEELSEVEITMHSLTCDDVNIQTLNQLEGNLYVQNIDSLHHHLNIL